MDLSKLFSDVQLEILHRLNEAHDADLEALRVEARRLRTAVEDLVHICEIDDVEVRCCQSCRRLGSAQDAYRCKDCLVAMCEACNGRAGLIGVDGDGAERCLECSLLVEAPGEWE